MLDVVLDYFGRTNLFNFLIFLGIFIFIFKKVHIGTMLDKSKNNIVEHIENSKSTKEESEAHLKQIEETLSHIEEEIDGIIKKSEENAKLVGTKILDDAEKFVSNIKENTDKTVANKTALLKNDILRRTSLASIETAKSHIINELNNNIDLHNKLIDESIEALESYRG